MTAEARLKLECDKILAMLLFSEKPSCGKTASVRDRDGIKKETAELQTRTRKEPTTFHLDLVSEIGHEGSFRCGLVHKPRPILVALKKSQMAVLQCTKSGAN